MNLTNLIHSIVTSPVAGGALVVIVKALANQLTAPTDKSSALYRLVYGLAHMAALNTEKFSFQSPLVLKTASPVPVIGAGAPAASPVPAVSPEPPK